MSHPVVPYTGRDPLLERLAIPHCFGARESFAPSPAAPALEEVLRPTQVHGARVVRARAEGNSSGEADAVISDRPGLWIGVITADCLPILVATEDGRAVAAIHAGWRGLAAGIVSAGTLALRRLLEERRVEATDPGRGHEARGTRDSAHSDRLVAAIGPHAGACCYEVDAPVLEALAERFGEVALSRHAATTSPGHARIDLAGLAALDLGRAGIDPESIGTRAALCSIGDSERFDSYRRDGPEAGRMLHAIAARSDAGAAVRAT